MNQVVLFLTVILIALVTFLIVWKRLSQDMCRQPDEVFRAPDQDKLRIRWTVYEDVITAYFEVDLPIMGGMMIFTDKAGIPRTGNLYDLEKLAAQTGYELIHETTYGFYVIGSGVSGASLADDIRDYGAFIVPNLAKAIATANLNQAEANALLEET